ncbi:MAG: hypothetical protein COB02_14840 [Candidatus Cloacimonadota bacterium]|nr:MAG: hypothetical protein COB02_14840 [Candidatus Cloacimonadota bacterium]
MFFCFILACFLGCNNTLISAEVPSLFHYQGRFLDAATNRPVEGVLSKQIRFNIRKVNADNSLGSIIRGVTKQVSVKDGIFSADLDFSSLPFDEPYAIQVVVQGSGGGDVGTQRFRTVPYSFTSRDALQLGGVTSDGYAKKVHAHETSGTKSFTIDGSGANLSPNDTQFEIISGATNREGSIVFRVNASGDLDQVGSIKVKKNIEIAGRLVVRNESGIEVISAESTTGDVKIAGNLDVAGDSIVGSLVVSGAATLQDTRVLGNLTFGPNAVIDRPADGAISIIGNSHSLEHHKVSTFFTNLQSLVSGTALSSVGFHIHSFLDSSITSATISDGSVQSKHILDGTIVNADISDIAAIADSKLAQIVTPSKITTSALCDINGICPVPFKNESNTFGAGFLSDSAKGRVDTINSFDAMQSKQVTVIATNSLTKNFIRFTDSGGTFRWDIDGDGTLLYKHLIGNGLYDTRIKISPSGTETKISLKNVVFEGNSQMITGAVIKDNTITKDDIANNSVTTDKIADGSITTAKIANGAVTAAKIADNAIDTTKIKDGSIGSDDIIAGAITTVKIKDASITSDLIATGAVDTANIKDGSITSVKVANSSITSALIADGTIETADIGDLQITAAKIKDGEIGNSHLQNNVVKSRTDAMSITLSGSTTEANLTLTRQNSGTFLKMVDQNISTLSTPAILFEDGAPTAAAKKSVSLNINGSLSLKSDKFLTPVTLTANLFAVMLGKPKNGGSGTCAVDDTYTSIADASGAPEGTGFCAKKHGGTGEDYPAAIVQCAAEGAKICSINEMIKNCKSNFYNEDTVTFMTSDLVKVGGAMHYVDIDLNNNVNCSGAGDFTLTSKTIATGKGYFCCINP